MPQTKYKKTEPVTCGWIGFTNRIRKVFKRPLITQITIGIKFDPPLVIMPGESFKIDFPIDPDDLTP